MVKMMYHIKDSLDKQYNMITINNKAERQIQSTISNLSKKKYFYLSTKEFALNLIILRTKRTIEYLNVFNLMNHSRDKFDQSAYIEMIQQNLECVKLHGFSYRIFELSDIHWKFLRTLRKIPFYRCVNFQFPQLRI